MKYYKVKSEYDNKTRYTWNNHRQGVPNGILIANELYTPGEYKRLAMCPALVAADNGNLQPLKNLHIATRTPFYKRAGWCIPFAEYMRRFWVKTKYHGIIEMYALNKTDIRKELKSNVIEIMEVKLN